MMRSGKTRNADGNVPSVNWNGNNDKLNVNWYNADNRNDNLRSREKSRQMPPLIERRQGI